MQYKCTKFGDFFKFFCFAIIISAISSIVFANGKNNNQTSIATHSNVSSKFTEDKWNFMIAPYLWLPWINGHTTVKGNEESINSTPKDILDNISSGIELHMEANKGKWTFILDPTYLKLSTSLTKQIDEFSKATADLTSKFVITDADISYRFLEKSLDNDNSFVLEALVGGRYWYNSGDLELSLLRLRLNETATFKASYSEEWLDPVIGMRAGFYVGNKWLFALYGDVGGFGLVSHSTWQTKLHVLYKFNENFGIAAGIRAMGINYENGHGQDKFKLNVTQYGPELGLVFTF